MNKYMKENIMWRASAYNIYEYRGLIHTYI